MEGIRNKISSSQGNLFLETAVRLIAVLFGPIPALAASIVILVRASVGFIQILPGGGRIFVDLNVIEFNGPAGFVVAISAIAIIFEVSVVAIRLGCGRTATGILLIISIVVEIMLGLAYIAGGSAIAYYTYRTDEGLNTIRTALAVTAAHCFLSTILYGIVSIMSLRARWNLGNESSQSS